VTLKASGFNRFAVKWYKEHGKDSLVQFRNERVEEYLVELDVNIFFVGCWDTVGIGQANE